MFTDEQKTIQIERRLTNLTFSLNPVTNELLVAIWFEKGFVDPTTTEWVTQERVSHEWTGTQSEFIRNLPVTSIPNVTAQDTVQQLIGKLVRGLVTGSIALPEAPTEV